MKVINIDKLRTSQYWTNIDRYGEGDDICLICGKPLSNKDIQSGNWVHFLPNGDITDSKELDGIIPDSHDLGWWQVGNTCYRNFMKAATETPVKEWRIQNHY